MPAVKAVVIGLAVVALLVVAFVGYLGISTWRFFSHEPLTEATPENATAGAAWAGFTDTSGLDVVALQYDTYMEDSWKITWKGSPAAVDRFVASGGLTKPLDPCSGSENVYGQGWISLTGCQKIDDDWRRPDGNRIERALVRGALADGTYVVSIMAIDF